MGTIRAPAQSCWDCGNGTEAENPGQMNHKDTARLTRLTPQANQNSRMRMRMRRMRREECARCEETPSVLLLSIGAQSDRICSSLCGVGDAGSGDPAYRGFSSAKAKAAAGRISGITFSDFGRMERAFSPCEVLGSETWDVVPGWYKGAPLALGTRFVEDEGVPLDRPQIWRTRSAEFLANCRLIYPSKV
jgi:hypothetical protein